MKLWMKDFTAFWKNKYYALALSLTAVFSFGYLVTHQTVGIDDTPYAYYFEEGLSAIVGRWVMFLVNKVFHISDFAPFVTDFAGVLILMAAVTVWCVLMKKIFADRIPMFGYILYACLFLSNPLHSEVFTYYLHNGVATGYLFCGLALCCFYDGVFREEAGLVKSRKQWLLSALCLWIAMGCYESFMIAYLVGVCVILCSACICRLQPKVFRALCAACVIAVAGMVLRGLMVTAVTAVFGLQELQGEAVHRSLTEMMGWIGDPENAGLLGMNLKRIFVMYGVFAYAYYPIKIYVISCLAVGIVALWMGFRRRNLWIPVLAVGSFIASYLLVFIEGQATLYRSAQFLPMFCAWGLLLSVYGVSAAASALGNGACKRLPEAARQTAAKILKGLVCAVLVIVLWNQCTDMNKWFYVDHMKYENAKDTVSKIAYELEKHFDTSKPVAFTGTYLVPKSIIADAYVDYNSEIFYKMKAITDRIDVHLLDKYYRDYGVWIAQTPSLSVIEWGREAFDCGQELERFFAMHGHKIRTVDDWELFLQIRQEAVGMPSFPAEGSIEDKGEYIVVNF